jgi:hypothetical protein
VVWTTGNGEPSGGLCRTTKASGEVLKVMK